MTTRLVLRCTKHTYSDTWTTSSHRQRRPSRLCSAIPFRHWSYHLFSRSTAFRISCHDSFDHPRGASKHLLWRVEGLLDSYNITTAYRCIRIATHQNISPVDRNNRLIHHGSILMWLFQRQSDFCWAHVSNSAFSVPVVLLFFSFH